MGLTYCSCIAIGWDPLPRRGRPGEDTITALSPGAVCRGQLGDKYVQFTLTSAQTRYRYLAGPLRVRVPPPRADRRYCLEPTQHGDGTHRAPYQPVSGPCPRRGYRSLPQRTSGSTTMWKPSRCALSTRARMCVSPPYLLSTAALARAQGIDKRC